MSRRKVKRVDEKAALAALQRALDATGEPSDGFSKLRVGDHVPPGSGLTAAFVSTDASIAPELPTYREVINWVFSEQRRKQNAARGKRAAGEARDRKYEAAAAALIKESKLSEKAIIEELKKGETSEISKVVELLHGVKPCKSDSTIYRAGVAKLFKQR
jgi:hypothetical protein